MAGCVKIDAACIFYVLYVQGGLYIFGGCSREHPYTLDNQRISPVGLLHGAAA